MLVTILSKNGSEADGGRQMLQESSEWLFTGPPTEFQAASGFASPDGWHGSLHRRPEGPCSSKSAVGLQAYAGRSFRLFRKKTRAKS